MINYRFNPMIFPLIVGPQPTVQTVLAEINGPFHKSV